MTLPDEAPPRIRSRRLRGLARLLVSATLIGLGTVFTPKVDPAAHWSTSPVVNIVIETHDDSAGPPPDGFTFLSPT